MPFNASDPQRKKVFKWLKKYWKHELPDAELIIGRSALSPFCKTNALNNAAAKAKGKVLVIIDADAYIEGKVIEKCADNILENLDNHLWYVPYRRLFRLTKHATDLIMTNPPKNPIRLSYDLDPMFIDGDQAKSAYGHRYGAMIMMFPREALTTLGGFDERFRGWGCADEETQILTNTGWKHYKDLVLGESVLTLNHETGFSEWNPVQKINVFEGKHEMMLAESKTHSSFTTLNHRWPIIDRNKNRKWKTSETINSHDRIITGAEYADFPSFPVYDNNLVSLMGWFWTEGHIRKCGGVTITQSQEVHKENCDRIEELLINIFGKEREAGANSDGKASWRRRGDYFILNNIVGKMLTDLAPNKIPSYEFLLSLTKEQLKLFIASSMLGDGAQNKNSSHTMEQKNPEAIERFAFALILDGNGVAISQRGTLAKRTRFTYFMSKVERHLRKLRGIVPAKRKTPRGIDGTFEKTTLNGVVWCPTTKNSTWLARRKGKVYFTGNSEDVCFLRALDTLWGKHKTTKNAVYHMWHPIIGNTYLNRKWEGQEEANPNNKLAMRYHKATNHPTMMRNLVDEGHLFKKQ